ncbi:MAG: Txe/YoeB family addiction module toxin [Planctomycetota bacterium]|jgi:toxin YoeB|nr:Txe/YoeB family addiction module toxin [Planctomycetota bacterium]
MNISFSDYAAFASFYEWTLTDKKIAKKIMELIQDIERHPTTGIGKPEALKYEFSGAYSRRITGEHRLVYKIDGDALIIVSCRGHYD